MIVNTEDTICAIATPQGVGALGIIRVSGKDAIGVVNKICKRNLEKVAANSVVFSAITKGEKVIDEALISVFKSPRTFTGEDLVEISCHGSVYVLNQIMQLLIRHNCRLAAPGEFSMRAFLNGKIDLAQSEAIADLIAAASEREHQLAMHQMRGGFSKDIQQLREELIHFASLIELELDFGEEDVEFADRDDLKNLLHKILGYLNKLIQSFEMGNVIKQGIAVAIVGKPNAGKSTLLNVLLNEEKALVTNIPGTTRDIIEDEIVIDGIKFRFIDTAGLRETEDIVEKMGVERALQRLQTANIIVYLIDLSLKDEKAIEEELNELKKLDTKAHFIVAANKTDALDEEQLKRLEKFEEIVFISAKEKQIEALISALKAYTKDMVFPENESIVSNLRHLKALQETHLSLSAALNGLITGVSGDFIAMDIRQSLHHLGSITGLISPDDLLDNIFSRFCIGK